MAITLRNPGSFGGFFGLANQPLALGRLRLLAQAHLVLQPFTLGLHPLTFGLRGALGDQGGLAEQSLTFGCFFGPKPLLFLSELLARLFNLSLCRSFRSAQQPLAFGGRLGFESAPLLLGSLAFLPTGALGREFRFLHQALALGGFFLPHPALLFLELLARLFYLALRRSFSPTQQALALGRRLNFQLATLFLRSQPLLFADAGERGFCLTRRRLILFTASALVFHLTAHANLRSRLLFGLMGVGGGRLAQSRAWRFFRKDRAALRAALERVCAWPIAQVAPCHGEPVAVTAAELHVLMRRAYG